MMQLQMWWHRVGNVEAVLSAPDQRPDAPRESVSLTSFGALAQNTHLH
jgi:hypothetical protein